MVMRHHEDLRQKEEKAKRDEHAKIRRVASSIAKEVRAFWSSVEKVRMIHRHQANKTFWFSCEFLKDHGVFVCDRNKIHFTFQTIKYIYL